MQRPGLLLFMFLLTLTILSPASPFSAAAQGNPGRIVFTSNRDGNDEIYVMNTDGTGVTRLTNNPASDRAPAWSPDGTKIAFSSDREGTTAEDLANYDIYVMNADGSGVTRLTTTGGATSPAWSLDGRRMAFTVYTGNKPPELAGGTYWYPEIFLMNADGSNVGVWNVVPAEDPASTDVWFSGTMDPAWSPDGTRIAFSASTCAYSACAEIYVADVDAAQVIPLTPELGYGITPAWSPDGTHIAFSANNADGYEIYRINADGSNPMRLTNQQLLWIDHPTWSPDGAQIAFAMEVSDGNRDIYVMNADGSNLTPLTSNPANDYDPDWSRTAGTVAPTPVPSPGDALLFPETGYSIAGRIRSYWEQNGGLQVFGLPITAQQEENIEGQPVQVQWFERNRLELHPENAPPYDVLLGRLGADRLVQRGYDWQSVPAEPPEAGCRFFAETGRNVCGAILAAWRTSGLELDGQRGFSESENLALFGLPLTGLISEQNSDGYTYQVQYFERARFELHPENAPPYNVLLGLLGSEVRQ